MLSNKLNSLQWHKAPTNQSEAIWNKVCYTVLSINFKVAECVDIIKSCSYVNIPCISCLLNYKNENKNDL